MPSSLDADILTRFTGLYSALRASGDWRDRREWLRFAANAAVLCPLAPSETAARIREAAGILRRDAPWFSDLRTSWRFVLAAMLVQEGIPAHVFTASLVEHQRRFSAAGLPHGGMYGTMAIAILHYLNGHWVDDRQMGHLVALYTGLKRHHWWLAGPDDLPVCACLTVIPGTPGEIINRVEANLRQLRDMGFTSGNHLLHAACLLALPTLPEGLATLRFAGLARAFSKNHTGLWHEDYDALAMLCLIDQAPATVAGLIREYMDALVKDEPALHGQATFNLAADLAFLDLARRDGPGLGLHTGGDFSRMMATVRLGMAAALLLSTSAESIATVTLAEWPSADPLSPP